MFLSLFCYSYPINIQPASITLALAAFGHKTELGTYPLSLTHGEDCTCLMETLAIGTIAIATLTVLNRHTQIEVEMDGRAIGNGIALRRLKGDKGLTLFYFTLISPHTGVALKQDNHGSFRLFPYSPNWNIDVYNLEMVIRLAYAIDSDNSRKFRKYIMNRLMGRPMYENVCVVLDIR